MILADPRHEPKVRQGVTTEIVGVDGNGYAPFAHRVDLHDFVRLGVGLDGDPAIEYDWDTVASYLERYDRGQAINVGILVGNSALAHRRHRLGGRASRRACRWGHALDAARGHGGRRLRRLMGLDYPPGSYASTDELAGLTQEAAKHGGFYHTHALPARRSVPRSLPRGDRNRTARRGARPHHPLLSSPDLPGLADQMLELVDHARAAGQDVTFDAYPYEWASTRLLIQLAVGAGR